MQLRIQRSQRRGITNIVIFCLDIRAEYSPEEKSNIEKYRLGPQAIYNSRAAAKHLDKVGAHLELARDRHSSFGQMTAGLAKGAVSFALAKMQLNVTIASFAKGHHIECKDLEELLEAEDALRQACKELTRYLEVAATFNGAEVVIEYERGEEKVHVTQGVPPLLEAPHFIAQDTPEPSQQWYNARESASTLQTILDLWRNEVIVRQVVWGLGIIMALMFLLHSWS